MPCVMCGKDSGKFYGGSCPDCLVGRVRELEIANASLIGAIDSAIIEIRKLQIAGGELEASCAVMRDALNKWKLLAHFMNPPDDWRTGESLASLCQECILAGEQALSTTAGYDLLRRLEKLELVAEAVREYKNYAWKPYNHRTFSQEALGSLEKRVCDSLAAMDS